MIKNIQLLFPTINQWQIDKLVEISQEPRIMEFNTYVEQVKRKYEIPQINYNKYPKEEQVAEYFQDQYIYSHIVKEFLLDQPNVKIKLYKNCCYFGQMENNMRSGQGVLIKEDGKIFEGNWLQDKRHGLGLEFQQNGYVYFGNFHEGVPSGDGIIYHKEHYIGKWLNGKKHGIGWQRGLKGDYYIGNWENGKSSGLGLHVYNDIYVGDTSNNLKHGQAREFFQNGDQFKGEYKNGQPNGQGEYKWFNGSWYKGEFQNGLRNGKGEWQHKTDKGMNIYVGSYLNDKKSGHGVFKYDTGQQYSGAYYLDKRHGYGEMIWEDGAFYKGYWINNLMEGEGIYGFQDILLRGIWSQNQLQSYERVRVALSDFPITHNLKDIVEDEEIHSVLAEEPDLNSIGDTFKNQLVHLSKMESKIDDQQSEDFKHVHQSSHNTYHSHQVQRLPLIQKQFDLLSLMDNNLQIDPPQPSPNQFQNTSTQTRQPLPKIKTYQKATTEQVQSRSVDVSVRNGRQFKFDSLTQSPKSRHANKRAFNSEKHSQRSVIPKKLARRNKKKVDLLTEKEKNIWSIKIQILKLDPKKYQQIWNHQVVSEIKQILYPPVWKPPNYYI
ncbi:hypothetical protein pb186bvf_000134 [Paramecium bursaria]